jgi:tetratricopeptide (TPR) repeat protein
VHTTQLYRLRAITHVCLGNFREAASECAQVASLRQTRQQAQCARVEVRWAGSGCSDTHTHTHTHTHTRYHHAADADKIIELAPHLMDGYYHKGYALFNLKEFSAAAYEFQQGLELNPNDQVCGVLV